jgi:hypothetical protein
MTSGAVVRGDGPVVDLNPHYPRPQVQPGRRAPWHTPAGAWTDRAGWVFPGAARAGRVFPGAARAGWVFPGAARAVWHLEDGQSEYARGAFVPETLVRDIPPAACADTLPAVAAH